jgi:hypothetical protein
MLTEIPNIIDTRGIKDPELRKKLIGIQHNFDHLIGQTRALEERLNEPDEGLDETGVPEHEDDEDDPTQVQASRFHTFWRERHRGDVKWYAEGRWDELDNPNFHVKRYKARLWRWDPLGVVPDPIPDGMPTPGEGVDGYVRKFPVGHAKAGEYMPPRPKNVEAKDGDTNTFAKVEWVGLLRNETYVQDVKAISKHGRKGPWSDTSAVGSAADATAPPAPLSVGIDVDGRNIHGRVSQPTNPADTTEPHPDIAYTQWKVTSDVLGNTIVARPNGELLFDGYHVGSKKRFKFGRPRGNYYLWARNADGSGNKSAWVSSPSGNKTDPPTPVNAPSGSFDPGGIDDRVRLLVSGTYGGTLTDVDADKLSVRLRITRSDGSSVEKPRFQSVDLEEGLENSAWEVEFVNIPEGALCKVDYRIIDKDRNKSGRSPVWQSTAFDVTTAEAPTSEGVVRKPGRIIGKWSLVNKKRHSHFEVEAHGNSSYTSLQDYDYFHKGFRKGFDRSQGETIWLRVRSITKGGTASAWTNLGNGGGALPGVAGTDISPGAVGGSHITPGSIDRNHIIDGEVTGSKIPDSALDGRSFHNASNWVSASHIYFTPSGLGFTHNIFGNRGAFKIDTGVSSSPTPYFDGAGMEFAGINASLISGPTAGGRVEIDNAELYTETRFQGLTTDAGKTSTDDYIPVRVFKSGSWQLRYLRLFN